MSQIFGPTRQLGIVVRDFDQALDEWISVRGVGPFYYFRDTPVEDFRYHGQPSEAPVLSIAFSYSGDLQIEIIHQQNDAPSLYRDFLNAGGEGLQHVSGFCDRPEYDARYARAVRSGLSPLHEGAIGGVRFAYFNTQKTPGGVCCEISESGMAEPRALFDGIRETAANWDGSDPLRPLGF